MSMTFSNALVGLKSGHKMRRAVWGEHVHLYMKDRGTLEQVVHVKDRDISDGPYNLIQSDVLADDWEIV